MNETSGSAPLMAAHQPSRTFAEASPVVAGYFTVSFVFGLMAVNAGLADVAAGGDVFVRVCRRFAIRRIGADLQRRVADHHRADHVPDQRAAHADVGVHGQGPARARA